MSYLVKIRRNGGGESVIKHFTLRADAEHTALLYNRDIQSDNYFVEEYDASKREWPSA